jgi:hypothetical protein
MKADYIRQGSPDAPLVRLYGYSQDELAKLVALIKV